MLEVFILLIACHPLLQCNDEKYHGKEQNDSHQEYRGEVIKLWNVVHNNVNDKWEN